MEKMSKNYNIIIFTIVIMIVFLMAGTVYKVEKEYQNRKVLVVEKRIIEAAINCINDDRCNTKEITLLSLIQKGYLKEEVNPITKMYYSNDSVVKKENGVYSFIEH